MKAIYTASARVTGGRLNGRGQTSDGALDVTLRPPVDVGGKGDGTNPEQLLAIGWAACFEATLATAAHLNNIVMKDVADAEIDSRVMLMLPAAEADAADFELGVEFDVTPCRRSPIPSWPRSLCAPHIGCAPTPKRRVATSTCA